MIDYTNPIDLLTVFVLMGMMPFFAVMGTCFIKFAIVFSLLRMALGTQQTPPNMAIYGLAIMMTLYVMFPIVAPIIDQVSALSGRSDVKDLTVVFETLAKASGPYIEFLQKNASVENLNFFIGLAEELWPDNFNVKPTPDSLFVLLPAFITSELIDAFKIAFLLYLPFLAIDIIVSNILLALGMMMVSPMVFSLPFKIILFVTSEGWLNLIYSMATSYEG
jgi:type III secretion protein R